MDELEKLVMLMDKTEEICDWYERNKDIDTFSTEHGRELKRDLSDMLISHSKVLLDLGNIHLDNYNRMLSESTLAVMPES